MRDLTAKGVSKLVTAKSPQLEAFRRALSRNFDNSKVLNQGIYRGSSADHSVIDRVNPGGQSEVLMDNGTPKTDRSNSHLMQDELEVLAAKALRVMAAQTPPNADETPLAQLYALTDAYIGIDEQARHDVLGRIMSKGVTSDAMIEAVIPATARYMGELWASDKLSFAEVTIGAARLQETVRSISSRKKHHKDTSGGPRILLVVPRVEQHTLAIFVVAEQMRRHGVAVHIALGSFPDEIVALVRKHRFTMVGISASGRRTLGSVRELVKAIRTGVPRITPIVVGGPLSELGVDVVAVTGADHFTSDAKEALQFCGIGTTSSDVTSS